jgi:tetratricopeptide (TPR) repeat protein
MMMYEVAFLNQTKFSRKSLFYLFPFLSALVVMLLSITGFGTNFNTVLTATNEISRHDYLITQFRVLVTYLRLILFPLHQTLDYDYPVYHSFFDPKVFFSFLFLAALFVTAVFLFIRSRSSLSRRLLAFGIALFFITLSVESSIIPIADVIFEHRLYLPSIGLLIALSAMTVSFGEKLRKRYGRWATIALLCTTAAVIAALSAAAFIRNTVWQSEISLWEDVVEKQPSGVRGHSMLGILYQRNGRLDLAIEKYRRAIQIRPSYAEAHVNLGSAYVDLGRLDEGMREFMIALNLRSLDDIDTANLFINIGNCYLKENMPDRAIEFFNYAVPVIPDDAVVYSFLGRACQAKGMTEKAAEYFGRAHQLNPDLF